MKCQNCGFKIQIVPKRSTQQNSYYWFYLGLVEDSTGLDANELHEIFKRLFLPPRFVKYKGREIKLPATTIKLSKSDFSDYLDKICMESGVSLPNPEKQGYIANNDPIGMISPFRRK